MFNDLPWERTDVVSVWAELQDVGATNVSVLNSHGENLRYQVEDVNWYELPGGVKTIRELKLLVEVRVPALGYTTLYFEAAPGRLELPVETTAHNIETEKLAVTFSANGVEAVTDRGDRCALYRAREYSVQRN